VARVLTLHHPELTPDMRSWSYLQATDCAQPRSAVIEAGGEPVHQVEIQFTSFDPGTPGAGVIELVCATAR
jgi:hypothetical protein